MRLVGCILFVSGIAAAAPTPVTVTGAPVAALPGTDGQGLCLTEATSTNPATDFPTTAGTFVAGINAFVDAAAATRTNAAIITLLDLSNNDVATTQASLGDFTTAVTTCPAGGCGFAVNDTTTSFATRMRGFLAVAAGDLGHEIHFGFFADDAVAFTIYDAANVAYPVVVRPPQLGAPTWRSTNSVTFTQSGLYPIEIVHAQIVEHAALEVSTFVGTFTDFELQPSQPGSTNLQTAGFTLVSPVQTYRTVTGAAPPVATACTQCERQFANATGTTGCTPGNRCNAAAVCEACITAVACGATCDPCGGDTPVCAPSGGTYACTKAPDAPPIDASTSADASVTTPPSGGCCQGTRASDSWLAFAIVAFALRRRNPAR